MSKVTLVKVNQDGVKVVVDLTPGAAIAAALQVVVADMEDGRIKALVKTKLEEAQLWLSKAET